MEIDSWQLHAAVQNTTEESDEPQGAAFLNRLTGEIVFLPETGDESQNWFSASASEAADNRAAVENRADDWLRIPKQSRGTQTDTDQFIRDFLRENGIDAALMI